MTAEVRFLCALASVYAVTIVVMTAMEAHGIDFFFVVFAGEYLVLAVVASRLSRDALRALDALTLILFAPGFAAAALYRAGQAIGWIAR